MTFEKLVAVTSSPTRYTKILNVGNKYGTRYEEVEYVSRYTKTGTGGEYYEPSEPGPVVITKNPVVSGKTIVTETLSTTLASFTGGKPPVTALPLWLVSANSTTGFNWYQTSPTLRITSDLIGKYIRSSTEIEDADGNKTWANSTTVGPVTSTSGSGIQLVASTFVSDRETTTVELTGLQAGDFILAITASDSTSAAQFVINNPDFSTSNGWTEVESEGTSGVGGVMNYIFATGSTYTASLTITANSGVASAVGLVAFRNVNTTTPILDSSLKSTSAFNPVPTDPVNPGAVIGSTVVVGLKLDDDATTVIGPTGYTDIGQINADPATAGAITSNATICISYKSDIAASTDENGDGFTLPPGISDIAQALAFILNPA